VIELDARGLGAIPASRLLLNLGGFSGAVFSVVAAFLPAKNGRHVGEAECAICNWKH
jgi:hypothetical protein